MTRRRQVAAGVAALCLLSGCATLRDVPMPGLVSGPTFDVTAQFPSALGLPEQAAVRFHGATVGEVTTVRTADYRAIVGMRIARHVEVPANARAEIRFSSPMGEAFVELSEPPVAHAASATLHEGSVIPLDATSEAPSATDLLASVSTLVTGGSFADMKTIITELNTALSGNAGNVRELIGRLGSTLTRLDEHTAQFDAALTAVRRLSGQLADDRVLLGQALDSIEPAIRTLTEQRGQILELLARVRDLSRVGVTTIASTRTSLSSVLHDLGPVLDTLQRNEANFAPIFDGIRDFGRASDAAGYGLFANFDLTTIFDPTDMGGGGR